MAGNNQEKIMPYWMERNIARSTPGAKKHYELFTTQSEVVSSDVNDEERNNKSQADTEFRAGFALVLAAVISGSTDTKQLIQALDSNEKTDVSKDTFEAFKLMLDSANREAAIAIAQAFLYPETAQSTHSSEEE